MTGSYWQQQLASIVGLGLAIIIGLALMPGWGLTGMTIAVAVGFIVAAALPMAQLYWHDGLNPFFAPFGKVLFVATLFGVSGLGLTLASHNLPEWVQLPTVVGLILGSLWLSCRFALPHEDRLSMGKTGRALRLT